MKCVPKYIIQYFISSSSFNLLNSKELQNLVPKHFNLIIIPRNPLYSPITIQLLQYSAPPHPPLSPPFLCPEYVQCGRFYMLETSECALDISNIETRSISIQLCHAAATAQIRTVSAMSSPFCTTARAPFRSRGCCFPSLASSPMTWSSAGSAELCNWDSYFHCGLSPSFCRRRRCSQSLRRSRTSGPWSAVPGEPLARTSL